MEFICDEITTRELIEDLKNLLCVKSIKNEKEENAPFGREVLESLRHALNISSRLGFKTTNLDNYIGYAEYGQGEEYIGVLGHIDVVPEGNGWISNPFIPLEKDGKVYARGAIDDKGPILCALYGLKLLKDSNIDVSKKVRIIFGTNEESGTEDIDHYLSKEKPPLYCFTPDAKFPIVTSEKGILTFELLNEFNNMEDISLEYIRAGKRSNIVPDYCECKLSFSSKEMLNKFNKDSIKSKYNIDIEIEKEQVLVKSYGKAAHGSRPELGENAIVEMLFYLNEVIEKPCDLKSFLKDFERLIGRDYSGEALGISYEDEESGHLTLNLGIIDGNSEGIRMKFNIRYPVTEMFDNIICNIKESIKGSSLSFKMCNHNKALHFPKEHPLVLKLKEAYEKVTGQDAKLLSTGGGTYAKLMPNTVAFGPTFEGMEGLAHQPNEYIEVSLIKKLVEIYAQAIYELARE